MRLGSGYTVEEQITKKAVFGGIQLDVFPRRSEPPSRTFTHPDTSAVFAVDKTPQELGLKALKKTISFDPWQTRNVSSEPTSKRDPWSLEGYRRRTGSLTLTAYYHPHRPSILQAAYASSHVEVTSTRRSSPMRCSIYLTSVQRQSEEESWSWHLRKLQSERECSRQLERHRDDVRMGIAAGGAM